MLKSLKSRGSDAVKELAQQGAKTFKLVHQTGRGRKILEPEHINFAFL